MKLPHSITQFSITTASYRIADDAGARATLHVHYADNSYELEPETTPATPRLQMAAAVVAQDLLSRKHGVNFAAAKIEA